MNASERIIALKEYAGGISWAALARKTGIRTQQRFYDIRDGKHSITTNLAQQIGNAFPEISQKWLIFGEGEMLVDINEITSVVVPVIDMTKSSGELYKGGEMSVGSLFPEAEYVMTGNDAAMSEYPEGSYIVAKEVRDIDTLLPSKDYVFLVGEYCLLRRYQQELPDGKVMLYSTNQATFADGMKVYAPMNVSREKIIKAYAVLGYLKQTT